MITKEEYGLLKYYHTTGYRWIARDENEELCVYETKPIKLTCSWLNFNIRERFDTVCDDDHLFQYIKWEDEEPTKILDLIHDYEKHEELKGKVVIQQFVADWIEEIKDKNCAHALEILFNTASMPTEVYDWLKQDSKNWDIMARAWLDGYVVVQEKLYTVRLANGDCLYKFKDIEVGWTNGYSNYKNDKDFQLTQSEIESIDPIFMQIAEEVE